MNQIFAGEAAIHFGPADFTIMEPGHYVKCAVTNAKIPLDQLRYWSHERQEAYIDAAASLKAFQRVAG
ncbi:MAG: DUF2093 domain-containing protein [Hellea sp.]|nr:DUF2093 domain-containing protein [Hellea sp.]